MTNTHKASPFETSRFRAAGLCATDALILLAIARKSDGGHAQIPARWISEQALISKRQTHRRLRALQRRGLISIRPNIAPLPNQYGLTGEGQRLFRLAEGASPESSNRSVSNGAKEQKEFGPDE